MRMSADNKFQFNFFQFNFGEDPKPIVTKTSEGKGNIAKWFGKGDAIEGDITEFEYGGAVTALPTKMFNENFSQLEETEATEATEETEAE